MKNEYRIFDRTCNAVSWLNSKVELWAGVDRETQDGFYDLLESGQPATVLSVNGTRYIACLVEKE